MGLKEFAFRNLIYRPVSQYMAGPVERYLRELNRSQFQATDLLQAWQYERLCALLRHAHDHVPFYREPELSHPASPTDMAESVAKLPFLKKTDLQESGAQLRSAVSLGRMSTKTTGGSTGEPVTVWKTRDAWAWELAATWRGYQWAGTNIGDLQARFWGVPNDSSGRLRARAIDFACRRVRIPAFKFTDDDMRAYVDILNRGRPRFFYGYVSMLTEFARFLQRRNETLRFAPRCTVTTSEVLSPADRELLQNVFGAPVFNEYGCGELGTIAHECAAGSLHLSEENMYVEVVSGETVVAPGQTGELVVTELNNWGFPLIRYRTGDYGTLSPTPCPCGRNLRTLQDVQGRAYDFIRNRQGELFHGEFIMYIFEDLRRQGFRIKQFQVIQDDLDTFRVRIVPDEGYDAACEDTIAERIRGQVDADAIIHFEHISEVERERSGKLRLIKGLGTN